MRIPQAQYFCAIAATGGAMALGTVIGWSAPTMKRVENGELGFPVSKEQFSWIGSLMTLGAALQCLPTGWLCDWLGRKFTMLLMMPLLLIGWLLIIFACCVEMLYVARFLLGISGGAFCVLAPIYIAEIAEKQVRGRLCTLFQMLLVIGILLAYIFGVVVEVVWFSAGCALIPIVSGLALLIVPESPTFYANKQKLDKAAEAIRWLRPAAYDSDAEIHELKTATLLAQQDRKSLGEALGQKATRKAITISVILMLIQQFAGINAIIFYANDIFAEAKTGIDADLSAILIGALNTAATVVSVILIDKAGRIFLMLISITMQLVSSLGMMVFFMLKESGHSTDSLGWLPLLSLCLFICFFAVGMGPVPWVMSGELFMPEMKGVVGPLAGFTSWGSAFVITKTFVNLVALLGTSGAFALFAAVAFLGLIFIWFCVPETKGKSLYEIQEMLA